VAVVEMSERIAALDVSQPHRARLWSNDYAGA
jgi:hypothetical protein